MGCHGNGHSGWVLGLVVHRVPWEFSRGRGCEENKVSGVVVCVRKAVWEVGRMGVGGDTSASSVSGTASTGSTGWWEQPLWTSGMR